MTGYSGKIIDSMTEAALSVSGGVLLHCCCGPCATAVAERVVKTVKPVFYYYNPNIQPREEYFKRLDELKKVAAHFKLELIYEDYDENEFINAVKGLEHEREGGTRCPVCFTLRLKKTAERAKIEGLPAFCTTLTVSPHKNAEIINGIGFDLEKQTGIKWIPSDFKKRDGYKRSTVISEELGLYRQNYCGCMFAVAAEKNL